MVGLNFATINCQVSPVWPATGIAIGCVYAFGPWATFGVFIGAFIANFNTGLNPIATLLLAIGNAAEAYIAVRVFLQLTKIPNDISPHFRAAVGFFSASGAALLAAANGTLVLYFFGILHSSDLLSNGFTWWIGDTLGALFIVPCAMKLVAQDRKSFTLSSKQAVGFLGLFLATLFLNHLVFAYPFLNSLFVILLVPLLISAMFFSSGWIFIISLVTCIYSIYGTFKGLGPFSGNSTNENLIHLQLFLAGIGMTAVGLGTLPQSLTRYARVALVFGWLLTGIAAHYFYSTGIELDRLAFEKQVDDAENEISHRLVNYVTLLKSGASFFDSSEYVSSSEWRLFVHRILGDGEYAELDGIGVAFPSETTDLAVFKKKFRKDGVFNNFKIHAVPDIPENQHTLNPQPHFIVTYLEPIEHNEQGIGMDLSSEQKRYDAAISARDTGKAHISGQVNLLEKNSRPAGFLLYYPFYQSAAIPKTVEERRRLLKGFVFSPINISNFLKSAVRPREREIVLTAYSRDTEEKRLELVYESAPSLINKASHLRVHHDLNLAGHSLSLDWAKGAQFYSASSFIASWVSFTGTLCSLFLAILLATLEGLSIRAQKIADEKTKEVLLRKREWQVLTENSPVGIFQTDTHSNLTYANPKWTEITGISLENASVAHFVKGIHPEDVKHVSEEWSKLKKGGKFNITFRFLKDMDPRDFVVIAALAVPLKNDSGRAIGFIGTLQDITELYIRQNALMTSSRLSSLGEMASGVAHEINNPLTIIMSRAQRIESLLTLDHPDQKSLLLQTDHIVKTAHRIAKIIKGLQSFARETTGEPFQVVPIKEVIFNTVELCKERFSKYQVRLDYPAVIDENWRFWGREEQISQVLMNLLNNAFDAVQAESSKWIKIDVIKKDSKIQVTVTDSGHGIPEQVETKMFSPFFTTKEVGKGTGLGLSISKGIVERHGGLLFFDKTAQNTRFVLELNLY